jgi:hypothetical protein
MEDEQDLEGMTLEDVEAILERFVQLGLAEAVVMEDGEVGYRVTELGLAMHEAQQQKNLN